MASKCIISSEKIRNKLAPLFKDEELQLVLLFGSNVSGKTHKQSDIDLAFLFDRPIDTLALTNTIIQLLHNDNVDVIDLSRTSPLLRFSVVKNSIILYENQQGKFNDFFSLAFRIYIDTTKLRDAQTVAIKKFLKIKGLI